MNLYAIFPKQPFLSWATVELSEKRTPTMRRYLREVGVPEILGESQLKERRGARWYWSPREWLTSKFYYHVLLDNSWDVKLLLCSK